MTTIGYTRLSQSSDTSIPRQKRNIRDYCDEHGLDLETILDDGQQSSGFDDDREAYQELRRRILSESISAVVVNDKRRLARDIDEVMRLIPDLRTSGVELHTVEDGEIALDDPMRAAIEILQAAAAHEEKMKEIQRAIDATMERVNDPDVDHGRPRFGMRYDETGTKQIPGEKFNQVMEILKRRRAGESYREIAEAVDTSHKTARKVWERRQWYISRTKLAETHD